MTEDDYTQTLEELERLLNDPDVPMQPELIWRLLDKVSTRDVIGGLQAVADLGCSNHEAAYRNGSRTKTLTTR